MWLSPLARKEKNVFTAALLGWVKVVLLILSLQCSTAQPTAARKENLFHSAV